MVSFNIQAKPLPSNFVGTPNQLLRAFLARIEVIDDKHTFVVSDTQPATNIGPWFKNGKQLWVWNGTTYIPIDVSESALDQIWIGPSPPDSADYQYWFQVSGETVTGLKYYLNGAWSGVDSTVPPGSVVSATIDDSAATTEKFANGSVTTIKIQAPLLLSKWEGGAANQFARMNPAGSIVGWEGDRLVSADYSITLSSLIDFPHGLGVIPHRAEACFYCTTAITNWPTTGSTLLANTLLPIRSLNLWKCFRGPTNVTLKTNANLVLTMGLAVKVLSNITEWRVRFYVTP